MRVRSHADELDALGVEVVAVGFSPPDALAALAAHLEWPFLFLSDPDRLLYQRLELGRAPARAVFSKGTRAIYAAAAARGEQIQRPVEDICQLGGDALAEDGQAVAVWRPASPDDRPPVDEMVAYIRGRAG